MLSTKRKYYYYQYTLYIQQNKTGICSDSEGPYCYFLLSHEAQLQINYNLQMIRQQNQNITKQIGNMVLNNWRDFFMTLQTFNEQALNRIDIVPYLKEFKVDYSDAGFVLQVSLPLNLRIANYGPINVEEDILHAVNTFGYSSDFENIEIGFNPPVMGMSLFLRPHKSKISTFVSSGAIIGEYNNKTMYTVRMM